MVKIGDKVQRIPETFGGFESILTEEASSKKRKVFMGKVVYIHPEGRYHAVEFSLAGGKVWECFLDV